MREGTDVTIITYGALVERSNQRRKRLETAGHLGRDDRSAHARSLRLGSDRRIREENHARHRRARRLRSPTATARRSPRESPTNFSNISTRPSAASARPILSSPTPRRSKISSCRSRKMSRKRLQSFTVINSESALSIELRGGHTRWLPFLYFVCGRMRYTSVS